MPDLLALPVRFSRVSSIRSRLQLPLEISSEERHEFWPCPLTRATVTVFSCFQCKHFKLHSQRVATITKESGECCYPKHAPLESRRITSVFAAKVSGIVPPEASEQEVHDALRARKRKKGGMQDKLGSVIRAIQAGKDKDFVFRGMKKKYPEMSAAYLNTLWYQARKKIREGDIE